tara:strand:- start:116 stop:343 length:228 start_codon:yes stop_codon:yes gene_type:complete
LFDVPLVDVTELDNGVVHIKAYDTEFNSDQGEQRAIQIKLRKLLFGQSFTLKTKRLLSYLSLEIKLLFNQSGYGD